MISIVNKKITANFFVNDFYIKFTNPFAKNIV